MLSVVSFCALMVQCAKREQASASVRGFLQQVGFSGCSLEAQGLPLRRL